MDVMLIKCLGNIGFENKSSLKKVMGNIPSVFAFQVYRQKKIAGKIYISTRQNKSKNTAQST
jgi:hypothetical protein